MEIKRIKLPFNVKKPTLALGGQTKNTICFAKGNTALVSRIHSDLSSPADFISFEKDTKNFLKKNPKIIAYDLHPEYQSSKYALKLNAKRYTLFAIQHHHAHIASCMAENGLKNSKVIGIAFDGTGLGDGNTLWGAEFLICDYKSYKRAAHLKEVALIGGEKAVTEPYRLTLAWLYSIYKNRVLDLKIDFIRKINRQKYRHLKKILLSGFNSPLSSSMGRLFDAVASLVLAKYDAGFEAELAMSLEKLAFSYQLSAVSSQLPKARYDFKIVREKDKYVLDPGSMFKEIIKDLKFGEPKERIAYRFHLTVAEMIYQICLTLKKATGINKAVLSGGVFQNKLLLSLSLDLLRKGGLSVFYHKDLSPIDLSLCLGQAAVASYSRQ
jgi:hydrogenase maturation protein HypF